MQKTPFSSFYLWASLGDVTIVVQGTDVSEYPSFTLMVLNKPFWLECLDKKRVTDKQEWSSFKFDHFLSRIYFTEQCKRDSLPGSWSSLSFLHDGGSAFPFPALAAASRSSKK